MKDVAQSRLNNSRHQLRRWWCEKYSLPPTSEAYERYTIEELWVEFYEDHFEQKEELEKFVRDNPLAARNLGLDTAMMELKDGEDVQFVTGDPEIDELERRMAEGDITDAEVQEIMSDWGGPLPPAASPREDPIGEGFAEKNPRGL